MIQHYLYELKLYGIQTRIYPRFLGQKSGQTPGTKLSANQAPKLNHTPGIFAPLPMPAWHLKVPATHLDKPLITAYFNICRALSAPHFLERAPAPRS